jgi:hypothetical protein
MHWWLLALFTFWAHAHQTAFSNGGRRLYWPDPQVPLKINTNTNDLAPATLTNLIQESMNQWSSTGVVSLTATGASANQVVFTNDFARFGSAVIGLTEISYNNSGAINRAVIYLNDNYTFTNTPSSFGGGNVYLGDVVTHELGHLFGLSHSEVLRSSMFYTSFPGQSTISSDDRSGIHQKYGGGQGRIVGYVKGGNQIGVLGVHVQAISRASGESVGAITDESGYFEIHGLDLGNSYYIYTSPIKNAASLPGYFANVQSDFCPGSYTGSFFSFCGRENEGYPVPVILTVSKAIFDVGTITINCGYKSNEAYSYQKAQLSFSPVTIWSASETTIREKAFSGYFIRPSSSSWSEWERLVVDLTGIEAASGRSLKINLMSHAFGSLLQYEMKIYHNGSLVGSDTISLPVSSPLGIFDPDLEVSLSLSPFSAINSIEIHIRAQKLADSAVAQTFPSPTTFTEEAHLPYLLILSMVQNGTLLQNDQSIWSDNDNCLDAPFTYHVNKAKAAPEAAAVSESEKSIGGACGTLDTTPRGPGPGGNIFTILAGFFVALLLSRAGKKSNKFLS